MIRPTSNQRKQGRTFDETTMLPEMPGHSSPGRFPSTHWSRVLAAGNPDAPEAYEALTSLCQSYWYPIYAYVRSRGHAPDQAQDLTQDFFAYVLERDLLAKADPDRGRFRGFLRIVCARHLSDERERAHARKRGGGKSALAIDLGDAEGRFSREPSHELTPERIFDRTWALTLLGRVLDQLEGEYAAAGRAALFEELRGLLTGSSEPDSYAAIALRLDKNEGAIRVAVHRLRRRYGALLRQEIAATVDDPSEIDDEIRSLFHSLRE
jgi:RNA polymerase sigma-70 factor (ECF subfamily)